MPKKPPRTPFTLDQWETITEACIGGGKIYSNRDQFDQTARRVAVEFGEAEDALLPPYEGKEWTQQQAVLMAALARLDEQTFLELMVAVDELSYRRRPQLDAAPPEGYLTMKDARTLKREAEHFILEASREAPPPVCLAPAASSVKARAKGTKALADL